MSADSSPSKIEELLARQEKIIELAQGQLLAAIASGAWNACQVWAELNRLAIDALGFLSKETDTMLKEKIQSLLERLSNLAVENARLENENALLKGDDESDKSTIAALTSEVAALKKELEEALTLIP